MVMSKTLYEEYEQILFDERWKYYSFPKIDVSVFSTQDTLRCFFMSYLGKGEKSDIEIFHYIDNLSLFRLRHIMSCFLLGVFLYVNSNRISSSINYDLSRIPIQNPETITERFKYLWMLISIFHDFGYSVENKEKKIDNAQFNSLMTKFSKRPKTISPVFSKKLLRNYKKYRSCKFDVIDHGIYGGIKLYSDLCELREEKASCSNSMFYWGEDLIDSFSLAAWTVACHNVWFIPQDNENADCYRCNKLDKLLYKDQTREVIKSPFLFLLCLVDSIEPLKFFDDVEIMKKISFVLSSEQLNIKNISTYPFCFNSFKNKIKDLNGWLTDVEDFLTDEIIVSLKQK